MQSDISTKCGSGARRQRSSVVWWLYWLEITATNDEETEIYADNLDLFASNDLASVYNNVFVTNKESYLKADKIDYNFEKKNYQISMYSDKRIKIKLTEWIVQKNLEF